MSKLKLPDVTLFAGTARDHHETLLAIEHCQSLVNFNNVVYFSDQKPDLKKYTIKDLTWIKCPDFWNYWDVCPWYLTNIFKHKNKFAPYILSIHHDGYIVNPKAWDKEFKHFDFLGSPWANGVVGNNGFCFYSHKLIDAIQKLNFPPIADHCHPCDQVLFIRHRQKLIDYGVKIAPYELAFKFSTETYIHKHKECGYRYNGSFGFHGLHSIPEMKNWDVEVPTHHHSWMKRKENWDLLIPPYISDDPAKWPFIVM